MNDYLSKTTHTMRTRFLSLLITGGILFSGAGCSQNETATETSADEPDISYAVTIWTEKTELFFEYPALIAGETGGSWAIHLTVLERFKPVTGGSLKLFFSDSEGGVVEFTSEAPVRAGIYTPAPTLPQPGTYELAIVVDSPQLQDRIEVGEVRVYRDLGDVPEQAEDGGGISFLKEQQWPIDFSVVEAVRRDVETTVQASGEILPVAGRLAEVAAPMDGLVLAPENVTAPVSGERVKAGQRLATLSPVAGDGSYAEVRALLDRLRRENARATRLYEAEAIPEKRLIEARSELEAAESHLEAMGGASDGYNLTVSSPISGTVVSRHLSPGSRVEAGEVLFTIVDASQVWVRLRIPARYILQASGATGAMFTVEGSDRSFHADRVVAIGEIIDPDSRSLPITFVVDNADTALKIGMLAQGHLSTGGSLSGIALPNEAIQNEDGVSVAYVQVGGETFERRVLRLGASDGAYTIVEDGIVAGEHVVNNGAYQVYLGSLSTSDIATEAHLH